MYDTRTSRGFVCVCVCVCARACVRACVRARACGACVRVTEILIQYRVLLFIADI